LDDAVTVSAFLTAGLLSLPLLAESDPFEEEEETPASLVDFSALSDFSGLSGLSADSEPFRLSVR
jgi:hypothetical protein